MTSSPGLDEERGGKERKGEEETDREGGKEERKEKEGGRESVF